MSLTSRILFGVGLALVLLACSVDAHGWMSYPKPRGQYLSPPKPAYVEYAPATIDPSDPAIVCRNDPEMPKDSWLELRAGQAQKITLQFNALHVGDCFVYLTYDGDKPINEMKWFKIWEQHECKNSNNYDITIPSYLPSGDHVIFRWEWYALHVYPVVEFYSQCVDAKMTGSIAAKTAAAQALPTPQVTMPGHLPELSGEYADRTNNYWWPWDNQAMFFTGPKLATPNGQSTTSGSSTPPAVATKAPTPAPTRAPATPAPATQAPATQAPATQAPATQAPTAPPAQATQKPEPTRPPVNPPPAQSVKLNVLRDSSSWWFAASVSGSRANEITKMEIQVKGSKTFAPMELSWGDVFVYLPGSSGPISFPATVKASLRSGSSISFVVNGLPASIIDSGAVFA